MIRRYLELGRLLANRRLSSDELTAMRNRKLRAVVRHAYEHVPYYRELFDSVGLVPSEITTTDDLQKIPITEKEQLRAAGIKKAVAKGTDLSKCKKNRTSGSMGKPFTTLLSSQEQWTRRMLGFRRLLGMGFRPWDRMCVICMPVHLSSPRYRTTCLSPSLPMEDQVTFLKEMQPTILKAWPSVLGALMRFGESKLSEVISPRAVISSGEVCDEVMIKQIQENFHAEVFGFYAAGEFGPIASECRAHEGLHLNADQLIMELVADGDSAQKGGQNVVVLTSLYGVTMPFIRYRLGDISSIRQGYCSCGSNFPLIEPPTGRENELIRLPGGIVKSVTGLFGTALTPVEGIDQFRVVQEASDEFVLQAASREDLGEELTAQIRAQVTAYLDYPIRLDIQRVNSINAEGARKYQRFVSKMDGPRN